MFQHGARSAFGLIAKAEPRHVLVNISVFLVGVCHAQRTMCRSAVARCSTTYVNHLPIYVSLVSTRLLHTRDAVPCTLYSIHSTSLFKIFEWYSQQVRSAHIELFV